MTTLSNSERHPWREKHAPQLAPLQQAVLDSLKSGAENAVSIVLRTGLPREKVYESLVWLEGHGRARLMAVKRGKNNPVQWSAL